MKWVEWVSVARPSLYPALENRRNGEDEWMSKWVSECERERERKRGLHMAPTLLPTFTTPTTNDRGSERRENDRTQGTARRRWSQCQSVNQHNQPAQSSHWSKNSRPSLSHPIPSKTTLSDAPWLSPSKKPQTLVPHTTHLHTPYNFSLLHNNYML